MVGTGFRKERENIYKVRSSAPPGRGEGNSHMKRAGVLLGC